MYLGTCERGNEQTGVLMFEGKGQEARKGKICVRKGKQSLAKYQSLGQSGAREEQTLKKRGV